MPQQTVNELLKLIDSSVSQFVEGVSPIQQASYKKVLLLVKELDLQGGNIRNNLKNIKLIGQIKKEINEIVLNKPYLKSVQEFVSSYDSIAILQNKYFASISTKFTPKRVFEEVKKINIDTTIELLTENGIGAAYTDEIKKVLITNITSGGSYADMTDQLRGMMIEKDGGLLTKYAKQITVDSINQYNASYNLTVSQDLNLNFYQFIGSLIATSRPFCKAMVAKRYFHISEIPQLLRGQLGDGVRVAINQKTGLPFGMIAGTNKDSFLINRGGWQCGHQIMAVITESVPVEIRNKFEK